MAVGGRQGWGIIPDGGTCIGYMENSLEGPEVSKCGQRGERGWLGEGCRARGGWGPGVAVRTVGHPPSQCRHQPFPGPAGFQPAGSSHVHTPRVGGETLGVVSALASSFTLHGCMSWIKISARTPCGNGWWGEMGLRSAVVGGGGAARLHLLWLPKKVPPNAGCKHQAPVLSRRCRS